MLGKLIKICFFVVYKSIIGVINNMKMALLDVEGRDLEEKE